MKTNFRTFGALALLTFMSFSGAASAGVSASPFSYDFGSVPAGQSAMTTIFFFNNSSVAVPFFSVNCNGDFSAFSCFSMCSYLPSFGSCTVQVQFMARNGDGQRKVLWVNGSGSGSFATAMVYATDEKHP